MECIYCKKTFSNHYTLATHQKTTRTCLKIQSEHGITSNKKLYTCSFCDKEVTTKVQLDKHHSICKKKVEETETIELKKLIEEKDRLIEELKDELKSKTITKHKNITKNITNHITNNILTIYEVMKPEHVEEFFKKHYNLDTLLQGVPGLAKFICDGFIREKASYICTDRSRHKFMMKDDHGNSVEDTNCEQLVSLTAPGMNHVKDVYENGLFERDTPEEIHSHYQPISALDKDTTPLRSELSKIIPSDSTKPMNDDWKKHFVAMRESYEKNKPKVPDENYQEPVIQEILGYSLGYLKKYKEGYQKRKELAGCEVEIKGPKPLMELYETDPMIREKYDRFIKS